MAEAQTPRTLHVALSPEGTATHCHWAASTGEADGARLYVFHHDVDVVGCLDDLIQADDVGVHEQAQNLDLPPHCIAAVPEHLGMMSTC